MRLLENFPLRVLWLPFYFYWTELLPDTRAICGIQALSWGVKGSSADSRGRCAEQILCVEMQGWTEVGTQHLGARLSSAAGFPTSCAGCVR